MAAISLLNPKAEYARASQALALNISAAKGLHDVMKSNLGPSGTLKMLVSGAGDIKITKDGNVLLHEMQIQHPTASLISRASTAMDDIIGDGTTTNVLFISELLKQAETYISEGIHPRIVVEGLKVAQKKALSYLDQVKQPAEKSKESVSGVCSTSMCTKLPKSLGLMLSQLLVEAVDCIYDPEKPLDLHMVEIITMKHQTEEKSSLIKGLVLDHGTRHPNMPKHLKNAWILICNVSLEYEKTEVNSGYFYKTAEEREKFVKGERRFIEERVEKIIQLKKEVTSSGDRTGFVVINQKGIDPNSLDMLARENIMALRRAKRRNMERLALACGGKAVNTFEDLSKEDLGFAGLVYEHVLGEDKFTFVEDTPLSKSVTILLRGPNTYIINMMKDAVRDGLRAIKNVFDDGFVVPAAGAFEISAHNELLKYKKEVPAEHCFGVQAFADALMIIPKVLAANCGQDPLMTLAKVQDTMTKDKDGVPLGLDGLTGEVINPLKVGLHDNYCVKKQMLEAGTVIASNLLLVDEIMRAGLASLSG